MTTAAEMMRRWDSVDIEEIVVESIEDTKADLVEENLSQMYDGLKADQTQITPLYAPRTVKAKQKKGQPYDRVTGKDTGQMYKRAGAIVDNDVVRIGSDVPYANDFEKKYGSDVWGIGGQYKSNYLETLQPVMVEKVKNKTGAL